MEIVPLLFIVALFACVLFFGIWMVRWQRSRADTLLETWAKNNGYRIEEKKPANFGDGPTGTAQSSKAVKYKITLIDAEGRKRRGLITLGSDTLGTLSDDVRINWD